MYQNGITVIIILIKSCFNIVLIVNVRRLLIRACDTTGRSLLFKAKGLLTRARRALGDWSKGICEYTAVREGCCVPGLAGTAGSVALGCMNERLNLPSNLVKL